MGISIYGQIIYGIPVSESTREDGEYLLRDEDGESRLEEYWDKDNTNPSLHELGAYESDEYILGYMVKESYWGEPQELNITDFTIKPHWRENINKMCAVLGIEPTEPKFYLTALYSY